MAPRNKTKRKIVRILSVISIAMIVFITYLGARTRNYTNVTLLSSNTTHSVTTMSSYKHNNNKPFSPERPFTYFKPNLVDDKSMSRETNEANKSFPPKSKQSKSTEIAQVENETSVTAKFVYTKGTDQNIITDGTKNADKGRKDLETTLRKTSDDVDVNVTDTYAHSSYRSNPTKFLQTKSSVHWNNSYENKYFPKSASEKLWLRVHQRRNRQKYKLWSSHHDKKPFDKEVYNIMSMKPIQFNSAFKNPCWQGVDSNELFQDNKLHCLPYFYLIGVKKSGTTDLMFRLSRHPEYCSSSFGKESQWLARVRFGIRPFKGRVSSGSQINNDYRKVDFFSAIFDNAISCILRQPSFKENSSISYYKITGEASPSNFHMHTNWERLPGNENLPEPRYTNFHYLKHITPNAKIIVIFRDPVTRLYSDFLHTTRGRYEARSPSVFHSDVLTLIKYYNNCFAHFTERSCVYNNTLKDELRQLGVNLHESFNACFYAVFMRDMISVFGNSRILPILMPDYVTKMEATLKEVFSFLRMSKVSTLKMRQMLHSSPRNAPDQRKEKAGPMLNETRDLLYYFYHRYNEQMATLMNDSRYMFPKQ